MREVIITYDKALEKKHDNQVVLYYDKEEEIQNFIKIARRMRPDKIIIEIANR